ncbi:hypothetical protein J6590_057499 [Homalodisca vitripennis]|nr:hypothetical protein J6590_057499 [Homalodisca vitripennis]
MYLLNGQHFKSSVGFAALALCDWSSLQKTRRNIARIYCSPRFASTNYDQLSRVGCAETAELIKAIDSRLAAGQHQLGIKPLIQAACCNMFTQYMCSTRFDYEDKWFAKTVRNFDEVFWDVNQGYAVDFLPWLLPFYKRHMDQLVSWTKEVRQFIMTRIIMDRQKNLDHENPKDFTDALLIHLEQNPDLSWEHVMYELEDFLGGHAAIGNLTMLVLAAVLKHPEVGDKIRQEVDDVTGGNRDVNLFDRPQMPYTEAVMLEVLRTSSSPIVPHVATEDTTIGEYNVAKGTVVFLNNYELNLGDAHFKQPEKFQPERFVEKGKIKKPQEFIPFSTGKRTCIGHRLVQSFCFTLIASLLGRYHISADLSTVKTYPACVALPPDTFDIHFTARQRH